MSGHGHVTPNADGSLARCGGPGICDECSAEAARQQPKTVPIHVYESAVKGRQDFRKAFAELREACLKDIAGAGPLTGPTYHEHIRMALGIPAEGSGPEAIEQSGGVRDDG